MTKRCWSLLLTDRSMQMTLWLWQIFGSREISAFSMSCLLVAMYLWLLLDLPLPLWFSIWIRTLIFDVGIIEIYCTLGNMDLNHVCTIVFFPSQVFPCATCTVQVGNGNSFSSGNGTHNSGHVDLHTISCTYTDADQSPSHLHACDTESISVHTHTYSIHVHIRIYTHTHTCMLSYLWHVSIPCDNLR